MEWLTACHQKDAMRHFKSFNAPLLAHVPQVGHPYPKL